MDTHNVAPAFVDTDASIIGKLTASPAALPAAESFRHIFEQAPVALAQLDLAGVVICANQRCCDLLGCPASDLCGAPFAALELPPDATGIARLWEPATVPIAPLDLRLRVKTGGFIWARVTATIAHDATGTPTDILLAIADLIPEHLAEAETRRFDQQMVHRIEELQTLFDVLPVGLAIAHSPDCATISANTHFEHLLRLPPQANISLTDADAPLPFQITRAGQPLAAAELPLHYAAAHDVPVDAAEFAITHPDGVTHHLFGYAMPLHASDGSVRGAAGAFMEISALLRGESAAQEHAAMLDAALESSADGVALHDAQGRLVQINSALRALLGLDAAPDFAHLTIAERGTLLQVTDAAGNELPCEDRPALRTLSGAVLAGDTTLDVRVKTLDDRTVFLNISGAPVRDAAGSITGSVLIYRDVTARRKLEAALVEQVNQKGAVLDALTDGLIVYDTQHRQLHANPAARALLGLDERPLFANLPLADRATIMRPRDAQGQPMAVADLPLARILQGTSLTSANAIPMQVRHLEGGDITVSVTGAPIFDAAGQISGAVCVIRDISAQAKLEREQWDMLNIVSHELKTPITSMKLLAQVCTRRLENDQHPEVDTLHKIMRDINRVTRLITDLGEAARMERGKLALIRSTCDLVQLCHDAAQEQALVSGRHVAVVAPTDGVLIQADADRLRQILTNLLNNACKYTPEDAAISLTVRLDARKVVVEVCDTGPGIPEDALGQIFDRFYRVPDARANRSRVSLGLGLGLAICKALVEAHGGRIGVTSQLGQGTTFWFTLPQTPPDFPQD